MQIEGKTVLGSGTLVLAAQESGAIDIGNGLMKVGFANDAGAARVDVDPRSGGVLFYNMDGATVGAFVRTSITVPGGSITARFAIWAMAPPLIGRVVHYTITQN
ncbi:hypothetical protein [Sphingomonas sp. LR55]|uniref:hypothetical protein n=1 Tax=Sphingomonas sp. LR55 TaxID=3050231 RepID=UPI002FE2B155